MNANDKQEFLRILTGLSLIKPGKELTKDALGVYWNALEDWSIEDFRAAANHLAKSCEFMPNPFHFEQLRKAQEPSKHEAWQTAMARASGSRNVQHPDDKITKAVRMVGGYYQLGMTSYDQLAFTEKRFKDAYDSIGEVESVPQLTKSDAKAIMNRFTDTPNGLVRIGK